MKKEVIVLKCIKFNSSKVIQKKKKKQMQNYIDDYFEVLFLFD